MCLSPKWEQWNRDELLVAAQKGDPDALEKLAELKQRSCGGDEVDGYLKSALRLNPDHVRANLFYGVRLCYGQTQGWEKTSSDPKPYLEKVLQMTKTEAPENACALEALRLLRDKSNR